MVRTRETRLDILRMTAMLCVMLLHCMSRFIVNGELYLMRSWYVCNLLNPLCRTGVPLFFMISGYLLLKDDRTRGVMWFYKKRLPHILVPLLAWNVIYYALSERMSFSGLSLREFFGQLLNSGTSYHLWFMYTMLGVYLLAPFIKRIVDASSRRELWLFFTLVIFAGTLRSFLNTVTGLGIYLFDPLMNGYVGFFLLGYLLGTAEMRIPVRIAIYIGGLLGAALCFFGNVAASKAAGAISLPYNGGYMINHFLAASALFVLAGEVKIRRGNGLLAKLSDITFGAYLVHVVVMTLFESYLAPDLAPVPLILCEFAVTAVVSYIFAWCVSKIPRVRNILM